MKRVTPLLIALCLATWTSVTPARAASPIFAALDGASADAELVVVIPQMGDASRKLAAWINTVGLRADEQMQDLLGNVKREMGMEVGLNDNGPMLAVVTNLKAAQPAEGEEPGEPDVVLLLPVSDYAAFIGNFAGEGEGEGVAALTMKDGSAGFAKQSGKFAVLGKTKEVVEAYEPASAGGAIASKLGPAAATAVDGSDVAVYIDLEKAGPAIEQVQDMGMTYVTSALANNPAAMMVPMDQLNDTYDLTSAMVVESSTAMVIGLDVDDTGIGISKAIRMKKDSELASYFPGGKGNAAAQLSMLPKQPYITAIAVDGKAINVAKLIEHFKGDAPADEAGGQELAALAQDAESAAFAVYASDNAGMLAGSLTDMVWVLSADDGAEYLNLVRSYFESLDGKTEPVDPMAPAGPALTYSATYKAGAMNLGGVSIDQFQVMSQYPPELGAYAEPPRRGYVAAKGKFVVITTSTDPQTITNALASAEAGDGVGSDTAIAELRKNQLPASTAAELYIDVGGVAGMVNPMIMLFTGQQVQVPADLPPIAMAVSVDKDTLVGRAFVPTDGIRAFVDTFNRMQTQQGSGGPRTRPGGPAPY